MKNKKSSPKTTFLSQLGPGLITGVSDDDPSGIATYSQTGAQFGYGMLWTMFFSYPLMVAVQIISAQIGRVTGKGIAANIREQWGMKPLYLLLFLLLAANIINIGADVLAVGEAIRLIVGGPILAYCFLFGAASIVLQVYVPYTSYVKYLKWLTLTLFAYIITLFSVKIPWGRVALATIIPSVRLDAKSLQAIVAILGTTISPYLFFWQASEEVEDQECNKSEGPLKNNPKQAPKQLARIRMDTFVGMACSNIVAFAIIATTAATLNAHGQTQIETAAQAAEALRPIAGKISFLLFSIGIIGTGMLAIPVLAGSCAYAVGEAFKWKTGLEQPVHKAKEFYLIIAGTTGLGVLLDFVHINPIKALIWAAIINGVVAVPILVVITHMASKKEVMGDFQINKILRSLGWITALVMFVAAVAMLATSFSS